MQALVVLTKNFLMEDLQRMADRSPDAHFINKVCFVLLVVACPIRICFLDLVAHLHRGRGRLSSIIAIHVQPPRFTIVDE
jgi:hypothetical protein